MSILPLKGFTSNNIFLFFIILLVRFKKTFTFANKVFALSLEKITPISFYFLLLICFLSCEKDKVNKHTKSLNDEEFSFLFKEKELPMENEVAYEGNLPCDHCRMISTYLYFDLQRFIYKRRQKFYTDEQTFTTKIDSGALSFIQGNDLDAHALIYGLEADTSQIQYFLIINETDLELLNDQLLPLGIIPAPILHKQAIRQISNKQ
jgi:hypothetical protein